MLIVFRVILIALYMNWLKQAKRNFRPKMMSLLGLVYVVCFLLGSTGLDDVQLSFFIVCVMYGALYLVTFLVISLILLFTNSKQVH